jgi:hypothetical protein
MDFFWPEPGELAILAPVFTLPILVPAFWPPSAFRVNTVGIRLRGPGTK